MRKNAVLAFAGGKRIFQMEANAFIFPIMVIAVVIVALAAVLFIMMHFIKERDDADAAIASAQASIDARRADRLRIAREITAAFGESTKADEQFARLLSSYPSVRSDEEEKRWEAVYIPAMRSFMSRAKKHAAPHMRNAVKIADDTLIGNENALDAARAELMGCFERRARLETQPYRAVLMLADKAVSGMRAGTEATHKGRETYERLRAERQQSYIDAGFVSDNANAPSSSVGMDRHQQAPQQIEFIE